MFPIGWYDPTELFARRSEYLRYVWERLDFIVAFGSDPEVA